MSNCHKRHNNYNFFVFGGNKLLLSNCVALSNTTVLLHCYTTVFQMGSTSRALKYCLLLFCLFNYLKADCGCGMRCTKYSTALQCTRCCTATVRRSVPIEEPQPTLDHIPTLTLENILQSLRPLGQIKSHRRQGYVRVGPSKHQTLVDIVQNILAQRTNQLD